MYFNDDNPLGLIKGCHSGRKIKFPGCEEENGGERRSGVMLMWRLTVLSLEIVYSHNCLQLSPAKNVSD